MRIASQISLPQAALLAAVLAAFVLTAADFEGGHTVTLDGFETRGTDEDGKAEWELHGQKARMKGGLYHLADIRLVVHLEQDRQATVTSERCVFDQSRGIAHSDAPLHVVSEEMSLDGVGYDIATDRKVLRVRSQVRMKVRKLGAGMSPDEIFLPLGGRIAKPAAKTAKKLENEQK